MNEFKVGDRVINASNSVVPIDEIGTVMFTNIGGLIGVTWDSFDKGHDFYYQESHPFKMKAGHGWYVRENEIRPLFVSIKGVNWITHNDPINIKFDIPRNLDIEKLAKQVDESVRGKGIGFTFINGNTLEVKKEKESMLNLEFKTEEGYRIDKTCNKQIPIIKTTVSSRTYPWHDGVATCDKADYEERQGILEALANLICNGNFDREYQRTKARYKKEYAEDCKCQKCGKSFATPELARECEKAHEERRKAKREKYLMRKAAIKRAKEMEIEQMAKNMLKEKPNE